MPNAAPRRSGAAPRPRKPPSSGSRRRRSDSTASLPPCAALLMANERTRSGAVQLSILTWAAFKAASCADLASSDSGFPLR